MKTSSTPWRVRVLLLVILGCWGFATVDRTATAEEALSRQTAAGREVLVRGFAEFGADCKLHRVRAIRVAQAPANGRIEQRPGLVTIDHKSCAGAKPDGVLVFYVPNDGFAGKDHFVIDVEYASRRTVHAKVDVDVDGTTTAKS